MNLCIIKIVVVVQLLFSVNAQGQLAPSSVPSWDKKAKGGDPVDLGTGLYERSFTDILVYDYIPISLKRTYRNRDSVSRAFGIGTNHPYEWFLWSNSRELTFVDLILEDGGRIHYARTSAGTDYQNAVFEHVLSPTEFYKSQLKWNGNGWTIAMADGSSYKFLFCGHGGKQKCSLINYRDGAGRELQLARDRDGNLQAITSPGMQRIEFTNDSNDRVKQAKISGSDQAVRYEYDREGRLRRVENAGIVIVDRFIRGLPREAQEYARKSTGKVTDWIEYDYDKAHNMTMVKDSTGFQLINKYDSENRPIHQRLHDGRTWAFAYKTNSRGKIVQTDVTQPDSSVRRTAFTVSGNLLSVTTALGEPHESTTMYERDRLTNQIQSISIRCLSKDGARITINAKPISGESVDAVADRLRQKCQTKKRPPQQPVDESI